MCVSFHTHATLLANCELHNTYGGTCQLPQWWVYRQTLCESSMTECRHRHRTVTFLHSTHPVSRHRVLCTTRIFFFFFFSFFSVFFSLNLRFFCCIVACLVSRWLNYWFLSVRFFFFYFINSCWVDLFFLSFFLSFPQTFILIVILCGKYVLMFLFL